MSQQPLILYGDQRSGNCYKIQLLCALLDIEYKFVDVDILAGDTQTEAFLSKNANGKIPLLQIGSDDFLSESNAILNYLADGSALLPDSSRDRAEILRWQFFEQYSHEPYIAVCRFIKLYQGLPEQRLDEYHIKKEGGYKALAVMEQQLKGRGFIATLELSIADISLYAYTHCAHEGGFDLGGYPNVLAWLERVTHTPKFTAMQG